MFKENEKVRIVNVRGIVCGEDNFYNGQIVELGRYEQFFTLRDRNHVKELIRSQGLVITPNEYHCIEKIN